VASSQSAESGPFAIVLRRGAEREPPGDNYKSGLLFILVWRAQMSLCGGRAALGVQAVQETVCGRRLWLASDNWEPQTSQPTLQATLTLGDKFRRGFRLIQLGFFNGDGGKGGQPPE